MEGVEQVYFITSIFLERLEIEGILRINLQISDQIRWTYLDRTGFFQFGRIISK
jgi:hypothetical protein